MNRLTPVPEVHTEGGEFRLDIVDDSASADEKRWRIVLKNNVLQIVLINDTGNEHRCLSVERVGTTPDIVRGGTTPDIVRGGELR